MRTSTMTRGFALGRMAFGAALIAMPEHLGRGWVGDDATRRTATVLLRTVGNRDFVLGLGTLLARPGSEDASRWLTMCAATDIADAGVTLAGFRSLPAVGRMVTLAMAAASAYAGLRLASMQAAEEPATA